MIDISLLFPLILEICIQSKMENVIKCNKKSSTICQKDTNFSLLVYASLDFYIPIQ